VNSSIRGFTGTDDSISDLNKQKMNFEPKKFVKKLEGKKFSFMEV